MVELVLHGSSKLSIQSNIFRFPIQILILHDNRRIPQYRCSEGRWQDEATFGPQFHRYLGRAKDYLWIDKENTVGERSRCVKEYQTSIYPTK